MVDPSTSAWLKRLRFLLGAPDPSEKRWLSSAPEAMLERLDRGDVAGLSPELVLQMPLNPVADEASAAPSADPALAAALADLGTTLKKVRGEGLGLIQLYDNAALPPAQQAIVLDRLRDLQALLVGKYEAARALMT